MFGVYSLLFAFGIIVVIGALAGLTEYVIYVISKKDKK